MKIAHLLAIVAGTAAFGAAAWAQEPPAQAAQPVNPSPSATAAPAAPTGQAVNTSSTTVTDASGASFTTTLTTNGPIPDTPANRAKYGGPMSHAGKRTPAKGN